MGTRKRSTHNGQPTSSTGPVAANFRPFVEKGRWAAKGTLPLPEPTTVPEILIKVIIHGCRKVLFVDPKLRIMAYTVLLFFFSLVSDYFLIPKTYFAYKENALNQYFVKFSWAWTFVFTGMFMYLTSAAICCGNRSRISRQMIRLLIGTLVWFLWTSFFSFVEESTGQCLLKDGSSINSVKSRRVCISKTGKWTSFDISGHSFLLIWCVFFITEEAKSIIGWDGIKDMLRNEEHYRGKQGPSGEGLIETPLNGLSDEELTELKIKYTTYDIPAKMCLIAMTLLVLIWDLMIFMTAIYFHVMIEKIIGGLIAAFTWFVIYRGIYKLTSHIIGLPGQGLFKYNFETKVNTSTKPTSTSYRAPSNAAKSKSKGQGDSGRRSNKEVPDDVPKFMGMPLYALNKNTKKESESIEHLDKSSPK